jgi:hypothetical protein
MGDSRSDIRSSSQGRSRLPATSEFDSRPQHALDTERHFLFLNKLTTLNLLKAYLSLLPKPFFFREQLIDSFANELVCAATGLGCYFAEFGHLARK